MDGIFIRKKINSWNVLLLCGLLFVALYVFLNIVDSEATNELLIFLIAGFVCGLPAVFFMLLNRGAYIRVEENNIQAKYHWFGRLDCSIEEVEFVLPQVNTLTILLKNGKRHVIMGIENAWDLSSYIRLKNFVMEEENPEELRKRLNRVQAAHKKTLWWVVGGCGLLFLNIFIAVLLTGGKDLEFFDKGNWICLGVMGCIELLTCIGLFYVAVQCGKYLLPIEQLKYRLRGAMIASSRLPTNTAIGVYTDENYTGRIIMCGFPNDEGVYYCVQKFAESFALETVYTSEIYGSKEELSTEVFWALIDITSFYDS